MKNVKERIIFIILRIIRINLSFDELCKRKYNPDQGISIKIDNKNNNHKLNLVISMFNEENHRNEKLINKIQIVLGLQTLLITIILIFIEKFNYINLFDFIIIISFIFISIINILLSLEFINLNNYMSPDFDSQIINGQIKYNCTNFSLSGLIKDYIKSIYSNSNINDFLADIFRASRRYLILAMVLLSLILISQFSKKIVTINNGKNNFYIYNNKKLNILKTISTNNNIYIYLKNNK